MSSRLVYFDISLLALTGENFVLTVFLVNTTYDHRSVRTGHPVRSAIHKH
jgi:hypothetical protein